MSRDPQARGRILAGVRTALAGRHRAEHPGPFAGDRPEPLGAPVEAFTRAFAAAGGEVIRVPDEAAAGVWLTDFRASFATVTTGATVPDALRPTDADAPPERAELGVSVARGAVGETGSLILGAEDRRRVQLLPPTHVVFVRSEDIHLTLREALAHMKDDLPSAVGLHSGPSKSADIGQVLVKGVHGPGRVLAVVVGP